MQLIEVPEVLAAAQRLLSGKPAVVRLPVVDVTYKGPHGEALGVLVRSSVKTAAPDTFPDDDAPESEVVDSRVVSVESRGVRSR